MAKTIAFINGSLRKDSMNRIFANAIIAMMQQYDSSLTINEVTIGDLPVYNQDFDSSDIPSYTSVREQIGAADAVFIITPEHNRTMTAALKNVIDITTRPWGHNKWTGKKVAVASTALGLLGSVNAGLDTIKVLQHQGAKVMLKPEVFIPRATDFITDGKVTNEQTLQLLQAFAKAFVDFTNQD